MAGQRDPVMYAHAYTLHRHALYTYPYVLMCIMRPGTSLEAYPQSTGNCL